MSIPGHTATQPQSPPVWTATARRLFSIAIATFGPGSFIAVGYMDPGNWATDLQGGAEFNYSLLFIVLLSGAIAIALQSLTIRLGIVTGLDLPQMCRHEFHFTVNFFLWLCAETAIIMTDLAEVIGAAISLELLFGLPIIYGVLVMGLDVLIVLFGWNKKYIRYFELFIFILILGVGLCFMILLPQLSVEWGEAFFGYIPSSILVTNSNALVTSLGILGATVMPHNLYLHSSLVQIKSPVFLEPNAKGHIPQNKSNSAGANPTANLVNEENTEIIQSIQSESAHTLFIPTTASSTESEIQCEARTRIAQSAANTSNVLTSNSNPRTLLIRYREAIRRCLNHLNVDSTISLVYATIVNSLILICAAAAFFDPSQGPDNENTQVTGIVQAYNLLHTNLGKFGATVFAVGLFFSGQCSTITGTLAGQVVMEGFLGGVDTLLHNTNGVLVDDCASAHELIAAKVETVENNNSANNAEPFLVVTTIESDSSAIFDRNELRLNSNQEITGNKKKFVAQKPKWTDKMVVFFRRNMWARRLITRGLAIIPALVVTVTQGAGAVNQLLVLSQVILGVLLPFAMWPLVYFTSSRRVMTVCYKRESESAESEEQIYTNSLIYSILLFVVAGCVTVLNLYIVYNACAQ